MMLNRFGGFVVALIFLYGCTASTPIPTPIPMLFPTLNLTSTPAPLITPTLAPTVAPTSTVALALSATPLPSPIPQKVVYPKPNPRIETVAENLGYPDFFTRAPDGTFYISDYKAGTIQKFANGKTELVIGNLGFPECVVVLPDGALAILENGKERLVRYEVTIQKLTVLTTFTTRTGLPGGIDDFAFDGATQTFIIPDTPNGIVWRVSLDGKTVKELASGFKQPTSAYMERDGSVLITDKGAGTIKRIRPNGKVELVVALPVSSDGAISDEQGNIFFVTLQDNGVYLLRAGAAKPELYLSGLKKPAAPMWDVDGNLLLAESNAGRILKINIKDLP